MGAGSTRNRNLVTCPEGIVHVLSQGELEAGRYLRAKIPVPSSGLSGLVTISATFCYATQTNAGPGYDYGAGLEVARSRIGLQQAARGIEEYLDEVLFKSGAYQTEEALRRDAHKWEPSVNRSVRVRAASLNDPVFDVLQRTEGAGMTDGSAQPIPVRARGHGSRATAGSVQQNRSALPHDGSSRSGP